jgi:hypothetical protein
VRVRQGLSDLAQGIDEIYRFGWSLNS